MAEDASTQLFGWTNIKAFGEMEFNTNLTDPKVTFRLVDEKGQVLERVSFLQSTLTPK